MQEPADIDALIRHLRYTGPLAAAAARAAVGASQATFSRLVSAHRDRVLQIGRARATRYAARRAIHGVQAPLPVYEIGGPGEPPRRWLLLHPVEPRGYVVEGGDDLDGAWFEDLPWFLYDLRPAGFLGRLEGRRHRDLGLPPDIRNWNDHHVVRYLVEFGWDLPGALIVGDGAYRRYVEHVAAPTDVVDAGDRAARYPALAEEVLDHGVVGSSAGGEQPKFLTTRRDGDAVVPVLVKFSPPLTRDDARRIADLLVAEHLAHGVLTRHGHPAPASQVLLAGDRAFLEVERFDRNGLAHRHGTISLLPVDVAHVATDLSSWARSTRALLDAGVIDRATHDRVRWLEAFGRLIANTDMHLGNLAFRCRGATILGLAPTYDMLPMAYAPAAGRRLDDPFVPPVPGPDDGDVWEGALTAAVDLWGEVAQDPRISDGFRAIAAANAEAVLGRRSLQALLPR